MPTIKLSIAICTYNRPELLKLCLEAVYPQLSEDSEILVIDNGSQSVEQICRTFEDVRYVREESTGLSHARNRAIHEAEGDFILYLDDDALADSKLVQIALESCDKYEVFGGVYIPWYHFGQPRWYKSEYASNRMPYNSSTSLSKGEYLSGGIFAVKKELLIKFQGFNPDLGMIGNKVGYGEESDLQDRMRSKGIELYYIPNLVIKHVVATYKLKVSWFLHASFQRGKDEAKYMAGNKWTSAIKALVIAIVLLFVDLLKSSFKLLFKRDYYVQNWRIDSFRKLYKRMGYIYQLIYAGR